ncbi:HNH endonuclease signature motif containing protein, partial [Specibacter sp. RAF43]|uniref:HNH endonuclease signature motif containing protein n=1 Tax=Specibacter sp. RAF43 TaxID=3233057 RepID=UPI003F94E57D
CTFPDCTAPAWWTEAHHLTPWQLGGETDINNAALLCSRHHHLLHHGAWTLTMIHGTPHFTPPYTLDPTRRPRRNTYHHGLPRN